MTDTPEKLYFNGINAVTGDYGLALTAEELAQMVQGIENEQFLSELQNKTQSDFPLRPDKSPGDLSEAGWGIIFPEQSDPAIQEALHELIEWRRQQAQAQEEGYFRIFAGDDGYRQGDTKDSFLSRHGVGPGMVDPDKGVPYYLLLVGSPGQIPYDFQYQLDVQFAVGRIYFDRPQEYANYARSVVTAEREGVALPRRISLFGVANEDDKATALSSQHLVTPLLTTVQKQSDRLAKKGAGWEIESYLETAATKTQLGDILNGGQAPALLFTASHGLEFPLGESRQIPEQGALLCSDWPGPVEHRGPIPRDWYFAAEDLSSQTNLLGMIGFYFACYGAGTPHHNQFAKPGQTPAEIAPHPFLAALPTKMLGLSKGGALAVVGHVERAWGYSISWPGLTESITSFEVALRQLMKRFPIGYAIEAFDLRYAELATELTMLIDRREKNRSKLTGTWTAHNDARNYVVLGDPAVRLPVAEKEQTPAERPVIEVKPVDFSGAPAMDRSPPGDSAGRTPPEEVSPDFSYTSGTAETVQFSAYHPRSIHPNEWHKLLVYAHLAPALAEIEQDAGQVLGQAIEEYRSAQAQASLAITPGTEIRLVPRAEGLEFKPSQAGVTWLDSWQRADFEMRATGERAGHVIEGSIACYVGPLLVADIRLPVVVLKPEESGQIAPAEMATQSARMYQAVFASYSHADTAIVEAVETAYKALGMDYLRDVMTLKSGQNWSEELLNMIEQADIFQLFWSSAASQSPYVEQEWQRALTLRETKGPAFIRPVYWETPLPSVPEAMARIHFAPVDFSDFASPPSAETGPPPPAAPPAPPVAPPPHLSSLLPRVEADVKRLTVSTYTHSDPADPQTATLKARTRLALDGDVEIYLSEEAAEAEELLKLHAKMVKEAVTARLAYLELLARLGGDGR